jgi:hypothetical protein
MEAIGKGAGVGLFERCRDDRHEFSPSSAAAGMTRNVCERCGLVLIEMDGGALSKSGLFLPSKPSLFSLRHELDLSQLEVAAAPRSRRHWRTRGSTTAVA